MIVVEESCDAITTGDDVMGDHHIRKVSLLLLLFCNRQRKERHHPYIWDPAAVAAEMFLAKVALCTLLLLKVHQLHFYPLSLLSLILKFNSWLPTWHWFVIPFTHMLIPEINPQTFGLISGYCSPELKPSVDCVTYVEEKGLADNTKGFVQDIYFPRVTRCPTYCKIAQHYCMSCPMFHIFRQCPTYRVSLVKALQGRHFS